MTDIDYPFEEEEEETFDIEHFKDVSIKGKIQEQSKAVVVQSEMSIEFEPEEQDDIEQSIDYLASQTNRIFEKLYQKVLKRKQEKI